MKRCSKCKTTDESLFSNKVNYICKDCSKKLAIEYKKHSVENKIIVDKKICTKCLLEKSSDSFHKDSKNMHGLCTKCKDCVNKYQKDNILSMKESREKYKPRRNELRKKEGRKI